MHGAYGWVYPIASGSMWPTLRRGEWVFLRWDKRPPERFDIVVFRSAAGEALVKRAWGLPNEAVLVEPTGDVRIGSRFPSGAGRPALVPVFDSTRQPIEAHWNHGSATEDPWRKLASTEGVARKADASRGEVFEVDSRAHPERSDIALLRHHKGVHDDRILPNGEVAYGLTTVNDLALSVDVFVVEGGGELRLELGEQGERLEFGLRLPTASGPARGVLRRRRGELCVEHVSAAFQVPLGQWFTVSMKNVDDVLTAEVGDQPPLVYRYNLNSPHPFDDDKDGYVAPQDEVRLPSIGERAAVGADGALVRFRALELARDIHVSAVGSYGIGREQRLGPDELFVLGDDPTNSTDSRELGPIPVARLIGRPTYVVWPLSAWRRVAR